MSGGSWDYLYERLDRGEFVSSEVLSRFALSMRKIHPEDCPAHEEIDALVKAATEYEKRFKALSEVFHDVEWADSGDYSNEQANDSISKWRPEDGEVG